MNGYLCVNQSVVSVLFCFTGSWWFLTWKSCLFEKREPSMWISSYFSNNFIILFKKQLTKAHCYTGHFLIMSVLVSTGLCVWTYHCKKSTGSASFRDQRVASLSPLSNASLSDGLLPLFSANNGASVDSTVQGQTCTDD